MWGIYFSWREYESDWGDAAAWFQAIFTVAALWLALRQGAEAARRENSRDRAALLRAWSLGAEGVTRAEDARHRIAAAAPGVQRARVVGDRDLFWELNGVIGALHTFDDGTLPSAAAADNLVVIRMEISNFRRRVDEFSNAYSRQGYPGRGRYYDYDDDDDDTSSRSKRAARKPPRLPDFGAPLEAARDALDALQREIVAFDERRVSRTLQDRLAWLTGRRGS